MEPLSVNTSEYATEKRSKINRTRIDIANKIVAFKEIISLNSNEMSAREVANLLAVPNSTMQSWRSQKHSQEVHPEAAVFFSSPVGVGYLKRILHSAHTTAHSGCGGIGNLQQFLQLSTLDKFIASSTTALENYSARVENFLVAFGEQEEPRLAGKMQKRKITAVLDEMFKKRLPCLVAVEAVSNYILLEKFTEDRTEETWSRELQPRLDVLNIELGQVRGLCGRDPI